MMKFLRRLICWKKGHRRGVRLDPFGMSDGDKLDYFRCPRCWHTWTRQKRKAKAA